MLDKERFCKTCTFFRDSRVKNLCHKNLSLSSFSSEKEAAVRYEAAVVPSFLLIISVNSLSFGIEFAFAPLRPFPFLF